MFWDVAKGHPFLGTCSWLVGRRSSEETRGSRIPNLTTATRQPMSQRFSSCLRSPLSCLKSWEVKRRDPRQIGSALRYVKVDDFLAEELVMCIRLE